MANGTLKVQNIETSSGSGTITLGQSGETLALGASNISGFGKIGQVVQGSQSSVVTLTSTSFTDTGLSASITPTSTSSKILIHTYAQFGVNNSANGGDDTFIALLRGTTKIGGAGNVEADAFGMVNESGGRYESRYLGVMYLDSPATTSATTYKLQFRNRNASKTAYFNRRGGDTLQSGQSYITLMEILP